MATCTLGGLAGCGLIPDGSNGRCSSDVRSLSGKNLSYLANDLTSADKFP